MTQYLIYFSIFMVVVLVTSALGSRMASGVAVQGTVNRRMKIISKAGEGIKGLEAIRLERGLSSDGTLASTLSGLRRLYVQSGVVSGLTRIFASSLLLAAVVGFIVWRMFGYELVALAAFLATVSAAPYLYLSFRRQHRVKEFSRQLPSAIDTIVRSLQAGHPLSTSLGLVASEMPDPIGSEFGILNDELTYGTEMERALQNLYERAPAEDLAMFSMTIMIQRQTGGNLAEILQTLSDTIRERHILRLKIKSLTAEGRFSAKIMTVFPLLMYLVISALMPQYFDPLFESGYAGWVFGVCAVMILIANMILRKMVNFRV